MPLIPSHSHMHTKYAYTQRDAIPHNLSHTVHTLRPNNINKPKPKTVSRFPITPFPFLDTPAG
jgi:hypothetical protein